MGKVVKKKKNIRIRPSTILIYIFLSLGAIIMIFPFIYMILASFKGTAEIYAYPPTIIPRAPTFDNYKTVLIELNFSKFLINSIVVAVTKTILIVYTSALVGFVLQKIKFKGRETIFIFILITMMVPWPIIILPLFELMVKLHWYNNYFSIYIPYIFNSFGIFLMRQSMFSISDETIDSARMDGATPFRIFHSIVLPQLGPSLSALSIFIFLFMWDDFLFPYLMLVSAKLYTIPVALSLFKGVWYDNVPGSITASVFAVVPIFIFYFFAQKSFISGMSFSGVNE